MLGSYVHIPFCRKKCNYCDFVSAPSGPALISEYVKSACSEMKNYSGLKISTVYIGGGIRVFCRVKIYQNYLKVFFIFLTAPISKRLLLKQTPNL